METVLEHILTSSYKKEIILFMASNSEYFEEAIELAISDKQPYNWRAAWLLWSCIEQDDKRIQGYIQKIISTIATRKDDHQRELLKILLQMELNEEQDGHLFTVCLRVWEKISKKPSVRFTAFKFLAKLAKKYPGLSGEIVFFTQDQYLNSLSPVVKKSINKMIKGIA